ncbi:DNA-processing protein DprA [Rossellomorea vietnamensis]|uniref:DNA-processing protein DprA n=1 Tax=Rossellomorea vietnamensis TaxID=218284 RepID=A0A5D4NG72_9BACI|nr:DNA-processing protein DprA [Rossellomorea vietnamensis]TYS12987.1 DNA-processing protein DprA [Rossellomorea vietnamensis]
MDATIVWIVLSRIKGLGPKTLNSIYKKYPSPTKEDLFIAQKRINFANTIKNQKIVDVLNDQMYIKKLYQQVLDDLTKYKRENITVVSISDSNYPNMLREIEDPPVLLYCRGNKEALNIDKKVAIVGTRNATPIGINASFRIAMTFSKMNYVIVSGLAKGIDESAHKGTLSAGGITIAVMPGGVDKKSIYPADNKELAEQIVSRNGLLVSEYPPYQRPNKASFVQRDRIQSGLSLGVCPVQTDVTGGTQHTIKFSKNQKRLLFCPTPTEKGDIPAYRGIHKLLKENFSEVLQDKSDYARLDKLMEKLIPEESKSAKQEPLEDNNNEQMTKLVSVIDEVCGLAKDIGVNEDKLLKMIQQQLKTWN